MGKKELKVVLDTNVLMSALLFKGELSKLLSLLKQRKCILLFSEKTLNEIIRVLHYFNPVTVHSFRMDRVVMQPHHITYFIKQFPIFRS